jgi:hypothetical protein
LTPCDCSVEKAVFYQPVEPAPGRIRMRGRDLGAAPARDARLVARRIDK